MGAIAFDYDLDGDQDLYLVHDGTQPNWLLRKDGGNFVDVSAASGTDRVGDGDFYLYVTNLYENVLFENQGDGTFRESAFDARVNDLGMGWGIAFLDYDNDGHPDLYVANETGFTIGGKRYNNILYRNEGKAFARAVGKTDVICGDRSGYGTAVGDFDGDGLVDIFVATSGEASELFLNLTDNGHHWLSLRLTATSGNRDAVGAKVAVYAAGKLQLKDVRVGAVSQVSTGCRAPDFNRAARKLVSGRVSSPGPGGKPALPEQGNCLLIRRAGLGLPKTIAYRTLPAPASAPGRYASHISPRLELHHFDAFNVALEPAKWGGVLIARAGIALEEKVVELPIFADAVAQGRQSAVRLGDLAEEVGQPPAVVGLVVELHDI